MQKCYYPMNQAKSYQFFFEPMASERALLAEVCLVSVHHSSEAHAHFPAATWMDSQAVRSSGCVLGPILIKTLIPW